MKAKRILAVALAGAMIMGTGVSASAAETELTYWALNIRQDLLDQVAEKFNEENEDYKVTMAYYDTDGIKDACKVAASSDTLPSMWFNWGGSLGQFYVDNGKTYDLTEYAEANGWNEKFSAGALNLCTLGGQLSGYPTSYNVLGVYYNKTIFEECGIEVPTTFEEFEDALAKIKEAGYTPMETGGLNGWHLMRWVELLFEHYAGPELHDKMNSFEESWDNEAVVKAFTKYKEWVDAGYFPDGFLTADPNDTIMNMGAGTSAMDLQGQWNDAGILENELDLSNFGTFPFPATEQNRMSAFSEMTQFNANLSEEELEACMKFMDIYFSDEFISEYPLNYSMPLPREGSKAPADQINVDGMMETANKNGTFTITDQAFPTEVADALFNAQDAIANDQMTPEEGAASIQAAIDTYLAK
ncbi:MAG: ABC transporter substrate-binding protein [Eubacteriales bacterium]|nr:ABC transporter substrate-binding protein [Eubacteriales bacterium]